jgi:PadR family transcriptional regulator PadR
MAFRGDLDALILGVLSAGAMHGYEITRRINGAGGESITVREAQLYPLLHRLESEGRIRAEWVPQEGKPARKVYSLTDAGRRELQAKRAAWERFSASVSALLAPPAAEGPEVAHG